MGKPRRPVKAKPRKKQPSGRRGKRRAAKPKKPKPPSRDVLRGQRRNERIRARAKLQETLADRLFGALELIRDIFARETGLGVTLQVKVPPITVRGTPWAVVGRFAFDEEIYYPDLLLPFQAMEASGRLESKIGAQRLARVQSRYELRGKRFEYTLAEIGPWELVISRCVERCDPDGDREASLAARYTADDDDTGNISSILVWLSSVTASVLDLDVPF